METAAINLSLGGKTVGESELALILSRLTGPELQKLDRILGAPAKWELLPGPQTEAAKTEAFETLYGGQAGGGKTELIAWVARHQHFSSLVLRRSFPELGRTLIPRMLEKYAEPKRYNQQDHIWRWPDGRRIELSYLDNPKDVFKFQGAELDGFFPDELTQFPRDWYLYIFSRIRTTRKGQRTRCIATTNPGGEGEQWVKQRWAPWLDRRHPNPAKSGEIRWFRRLESEADYAEEEVPESVGRRDPLAWSRTFIRAALKDNTFIGKEYVRNLNMQPEPYRSQLMRGDWEIGAKDDAWQVIPTAWVLLAQERYRALVANGKLPLVADEYGVDVARGGKDRTVIVPAVRSVNVTVSHAGRNIHVGSAILPPIIRPGSETPDGQSVVMLMAVQPNADKAKWKIDVIGVGSSAVDIATQNSYDVDAMNGSATSTAKAKDGKLGFFNQRAEWHWKLREALDPTSGEDLALPDIPEVLSDLTAPRWKMMARGVQIEAKEDIIERIGHSPDVGDATINAHAIRASGASTALEFLRLRAAKMFEAEHEERHERNGTECIGSECQIITAIMKERGL